MFSNIIINNPEYILNIIHVKIVCIILAKLTAWLLGWQCLAVLHLYRHGGAQKIS